MTGIPAGAPVPRCAPAARAPAAGGLAPRRPAPEPGGRARPDFPAHVLDRIGWVAAVDPARGARLRALYDAVDRHATGLAAGCGGE